MSTSVDNRQTKIRAPRRSASETRERIIATASMLFCQAGYDQLGVRELAQAAGVDPAVVIRLFGSKEALFATIAATAFALEAPFVGAQDGLGTQIAEALIGEVDDEPPGTFNEFHFLLRSAASPVAGPILSAALHAGFIDPLARHLGGEQAALRASLLTACILGFATLRVALAAPALDADHGRQTRIRLGVMLQICIDA